VLLKWYVAMMVMRAGFVAVDQSGRLRLRVDQVMGLVTRSPFAPAILAIGVALNVEPYWEHGIRTPNDSLIANKQARSRVRHSLLTDDCCSASTL
jgi:hypothetical protein